MIQRITWICAVAVATMASSNLQAATIFWQNNATGTLTQNNYSDGTNSNLFPMAADVVNFGFGGTATHSVAGTTNFQKLRVGHNQAPGGTGTGVVTVDNGAALNLTVGGGVANASMWVGNAQNGTLNIDGPGSSVTAAQTVVVGYGNNANRSGIINIKNGGSLTVTLGNIVLGETTGGANEGVQGHLFVNGNLTAMGMGAGNGADLNIGVTTATSSFTQTGGTVQIRDIIEVGPNGSSSPNSSFTISGGTTTHNGSFFVGRGASTGATANISGTGVLNTGTRFLMGGQTATGAVTNHSGGTLNTTLDVRVADAFTSATSDATYNLSGTGIINSTTGGIIGRQGIGKFFQTGGTANFGGTLSIGNRGVEALATNGLYEISAGDLNAGTFNIATNGTGELRVIGDDATIDMTGNFTVNHHTTNGTGTLAFELETGDSLSQINVTGTATLAAGSNLVIDALNAAPEQIVYNLLTAPSIVDNGFTFNAPVGWWYRIIDGGNGEILQAIVPEPGAIALMLMAIAMAPIRRRT